MTIELPTTIRDYYAADRQQDADALARCFTDDATVRDEGATHTGPEAIRQWKAASSAKYSYTAEPVALTTEGDRMVVTSHVEGDFPGSPVDLRYFFHLRDDRIAGLEIVA